MRIEDLRARAAWSRIRFFTPQQRFTAAREVRALRNPEVTRIILAEAGEATRNEPRLAEEWTRFSIQLLDMVSERLLSADQRRELLGKAHTHLGNALRVGGDHQAAGAAIRMATELLTDRNAEFADLLSVHASLTFDMGDLEGATKLLNQGQTLYTELRDRRGIARMSIQHACYLAELRPKEARYLAEQAIDLLPRTDFRLEMLARCIISESLAHERDGPGALLKFEEARPLISQFKEAWLDIRVQYLEACILEAHNYIADAERLYREVARLFWHREMYRDSFLVRLRLVEFLVGRNRFTEAAEVCRSAVKLLGETNAHTQMNEVLARSFRSGGSKGAEGRSIPNPTRLYGLPLGCASRAPARDCSVR
jgi:tetratricopeptide (TPR) repeat protein